MTRRKGAVPHTPALETGSSHADVSAPRSGVDPGSNPWSLIQAPAVGPLEGAETGIQAEVFWTIRWSLGAGEGTRQACHIQPEDGGAPRRSQWVRGMESEGRCACRRARGGTPRGPEGTTKPAKVKVRRRVGFGTPKAYGTTGRARRGGNHR